MTDAWEVDPDTAFGRALRTALAAAAAGDRAGFDAAFPEAVRLADPVHLAAAIAARHVDALRTDRDGAAALDRCTRYRARFPDSARLALLEAETRAGLGDLSRLAADLAAAAALTGPREPGDEALRVRLEGLAARHGRAYRRAHTLFTEAQRRYRELGDATALAVVADDLRTLAGRADQPVDQPVDPPVDPPPAHTATPASALTRAETLRLAGHYEQALGVVTDLAAGPLDPALAYPVTEARVRLLRILHRHDDADLLMPDLYRAADASPAPRRDRLAADRLQRTPGAVHGEVAADRRLQQVRVLVARGRLAEAEDLLGAEATPPEPDRWHEAEWHLAAGELTLARGGAGSLGQAAAHLSRAEEIARSVPLPPVQVAALRRLGQVHERRGDLTAAVTAWAGAHQVEERIAGLQQTDATRVDFLTGVPDEFDERVRVAAAAIADDPRQVAAVAVAIEAARGAALLGPVLPAGLAAGRELPAPGDVRGARAWMRRARRGLPRGQVVWLVHATTDAVHHVLVGRVFLQHVHCAAERTELRHQVDGVRACYAAGGAPLLRGRRVFGLRMADVAATLGVDRVLARLPRGVRRIAVVAGAELSDLPFGALPCGDGDLLGRRYALSDLPCLAVRRPLRARAAGQRGVRGLLVAPHATGAEADGLPALTPARVLAEHTVLEGAAATPERLAATLGSAAGGGFATVRIDSHGDFRGEARHSVLCLWPVRAGGEGPGALRPERFAELDLTRTGTVILGACDSGMQTRRGRDERTGFVRAGLVGGAGAVLAARWQVADSTAAALLDSFEAGLRRHPRDVALQRAVHASGADPVGWAAWTLYGDPGVQTGHGPLRRACTRWRARPGKPEQAAGPGKTARPEKTVGPEKGERA